MRGRRAIVFVVIGLVATGPWLGGCVTVAESEAGYVPSPARIAELRKGASFAEVIETCGVPVETFDQPDGKLLVYRNRLSLYRRIGFEPAVARAPDGAVDTPAANTSSSPLSSSCRTKACGPYWRPPVER